MRNSFAISIMWAVTSSTAAAGPSLVFVGQESFGTPNAVATIGWCFSVDGSVLGGQLFTATGFDGMIYAGPGQLLPLTSYDTRDYTYVDAISQSGALAGTSRDPNGSYEFTIRWTSDGLVSDIGDMGGRHPQTGGRYMVTGDISASGETIVGYGMAQDGLRGYRWSLHDGLNILTPLDQQTNPFSDCGALGISDESGDILGWSTDTAGGRTLVAWPQDGPIRDLTPNSLFNDFSSCVASADGTTLAGAVHQASRLFYWAEGEGLYISEPFPNVQSIAVWGVSAGGPVAVGDYVSKGQIIPFVWTPTTGALDINHFVEDELGISLGYWRLRPQTVSNDGRLISGLGVYDNGNYDEYIQAAFILDISPPCFVDWNDDDALNYFDIAAFIDAYLAGDPATDVEPNGILDIHDITSFVGIYLAGCP